MEIVKHGYKNEIKTFKCNNCGCIFKAYNTEYVYSYTQCVCCCPECNNLVFKREDIKIDV